MNHDTHTDPPVLDPTTIMTHTDPAQVTCAQSQTAKPLTIFGWPSDPACGYYRIELPLGALAARGHHVSHARMLPPSVKEGGADVIIGQRIATAAPSHRWQQLARAGHTKLVYELDDDLWHVDPSNSAAKGYDAEALARVEANIRRSDLVTVSTEPLADIVSQWNANVAILPNCIPAWLLAHRRPSTSDRVVIGYGASSSHRRDFGEVAAPLRRLLQRYPDRVEYHQLGADFTDRVASNRGRTRYGGWHHSVEDYYRAVDFDIGIAPLRPTPFNTSKSDIKLLEYAALGVAAITTCTGPYERAYEAGGPAVVVETAKDWADALDTCMRWSETREALAEQGRAWAATRTIEGSAWRWEEAYTS